MMSIRTLVELNHDYDWFDTPEALAWLSRYRASGAKEDADALARFGVKVIGIRHHADKFIIDGKADGFPPQYLTPKEPAA